MSLAAGTRLGPYEVLGLIGAGGMGEVYKARDTRLDRSVAIKILPAEVAADPDRRARFAREARAISQLAHPHICVLYDIGQAVLSSPEPRVPPAPSECPVARVEGRPVTVDYLVMEYLEGETLAQRLARVAARTPHSEPLTPPGPGPSATPAPGRARRGAPLPLDETLRIGTELAEALAAAHKAGIIHRDLKPGNVMLTPAGVKVLDFGLARLHVAEAAPAGSSLATRTAEPLTDAGTRVGTVPYMAPEQVEGKEADARSDVFALGAILYEMATGHRAFEGETAASVAAAILDREPEPVTAVQPLTPPAFEHVVTTCLAKDPETRWQAASDVARELRWIADERRLARTPTGGLPPGAATVAALAAGRRRRWLIVAALTTSVAVVAAGVAWLLRSPAPQVSLAHVSLDVRPAEALNSGGWSAYWIPTPGGSRTALTWTADGQALVFVGRQGGVQRLYVRWLDATEARPLKGTEGAQMPAVSADNQWVAFWAGGSIKKVPLGGGPVVVLVADVAELPWGLAWNATGSIFFNRADGRIWHVPFEGVPAAVTTVGDAELGHGLPSTLPGGQALLYTARKRDWSWGDEEIVAQAPGGGAPKVLLKDATDARYVPTGHLVFLRRGQLLAVGFDAERLEVRGPPKALLDGVAQALTGSHGRDLSGAGQFAIAPTGTLAWIPGQEELSYRDSALVNLDRHGQVTPLHAPVHSYGPTVRVSPDGRRLAAFIRTLTDSGLWSYDLGRGTLTTLNTEGESLYPAWSPDGQLLVFQWLKEGRRSLATQSADGASPPKVPLADGMIPSSWHRDGQQLVGVSQSGVARDILIVTLGNGDARVRPLFQTPHTELGPVFSRDGRWLAYASNVSKRFEVYVRPYPGPGPAEQVSVDGGESPAWNLNGRELFFVSPPNQAGKPSMMAVDFEAGSPPRLGRPKRLFEFDQLNIPLACSAVRCYDVAPDGQRFYAVQYRTPPPPPVVTHINLIQNWFEELKAKVPTGGQAK